MQSILANAENQTAENLSRDVNQLSSLLAASGEGNDTESARVYKTIASIIEERQVFLQKDKKDQKKEMIESFISYAARGGPQIGFGTMLCRAGYSYTTQPARALRAVAQGATINEVSWGVWLADVLQKGVRNEAKFHAEAAKGSSAIYASDNTKLVQVEGAIK